MIEDKIKVIAFGIGTSCKDYLENYQDEYNILALCDWDKTTHGTERYGLEIIDPYTLEAIEFDKILILSFYVKEIIEQLKQRINIDPDKIIVPAKYKIKGDILPFQDPKTKEFGRHLIIYFNLMAQKANVDLFLEFGTLLGITRDGDIIDWDDDIDLTVNEEDADKMVETLLENKDILPFSDKLLWEAKVRKDVNNKIWYISLRYTNKNELVYRPFEIAIGVRKFLDDRSVCMRNTYLSCNKEHFSKSENIKFQNEDIKVPYRHEEYLNLVYGNWKEPAVYTFGSAYGSSYSGSTDDIRVEVKEEVLF